MDRSPPGSPVHGILQARILGHLKCGSFISLTFRASSTHSTAWDLQSVDFPCHEENHDKMVGWHHRIHGHEFEQAPGVGDGQGSLACCSPWGRKELDMTERLN